MNNVRKMFGYGIFVMFFLFIIAYNTQILDPRTNIIMKRENEWNKLRNAGYWEITPIIIDDTGGGDYTWPEAFNQTWCTGSGIWNDPYIIENVTINGLGSFSCLTIVQSNVYFVIKNCTFYNSGSYKAGLRLNKVDNGQIINNNCSLNNIGIFLDNQCSNNTISWNIVNNNLEDGISLFNSTDNLISRNTVNNNKNGINLNNSYNTAISRNTVNHNKERGIDVSQSININITLNIVKFNIIGIYLVDSSNSVISGNSLIYNSNCIVEVNGLGNTIKNNECINLYFGFISLYSLLGGVGAVSATIGGSLITYANSRPKRRAMNELLNLPQTIRDFKTFKTDDGQLPNKHLNQFEKIPFDFLNLIEKIAVLSYEYISIEMLEKLDKYHIYANRFLLACSLCRKGKYNEGIKKLEDIKNGCLEENFEKLYSEVNSFLSNYLNQQEKNIGDVEDEINSA